MPGPAPARNPRRRNARPDWFKLPREGRKGPAPDWPMGGRFPSTRVRELWESLWATPQAEAWEMLGWTRVVARYAVLVVEAENDLASPGERGPNASLLGEVRQLEDRIGLTPMAMRRLLWEVVDDAADELAVPAGVTSIESRRAALS